MNLITLIILIIQLFLFIWELILLIKLSSVFPDPSLLKTKTYPDNTKFLEQSPKYSIIFNNIVKDTWYYFSKNKGAAIDFNIIKDICERHDVVYEKSISTRLALPLYVGLLGTMLGIIIGITNNFNIQNTDTISSLLVGVKIAMIGSFTGLFLTLINSGFIYPYVKFKRNKNKNSYFSFIQIEYSKELSPDLLSSITSIGLKLNEFNTDFGENIGNLVSTTNIVSSVQDSNNKLLDKINNIGFGSIVKDNIELFSRINSTVDKLSSLREVFDKFQNLVEVSSNIHPSIIALIQKIEGFDNRIKLLFENIKTRVDESIDLHNFLKVHYESLINLSDQTNSIITQQLNSIESSNNKFITFLEDYLQDTKEKINEVVRQGEIQIDNNVINIISSFKQSLDQTEHSFKNTILESESTLKKAVSEATLSNFAVKLDNIENDVRNSGASFNSLCSSLNDLISETIKLNKLIPEILKNEKKQKGIKFWPFRVN